MFALYIILGWILVAIVVLTILYYRKELKMTSATTCKVLRAENREVRDSKGRHDLTDVHCNFEVNGVVYTVSQAFPGKNADRFPPGRKLPVRYNPGDPQMARIPVS